MVEAVIAIVLTGILAGIVAVFIRAPVEGYVDSVRRAELTDAADTALRRISRETRTALPNSLRGPSDGSLKCFEFLPVAGSGRYRAAQSDSATGDELSFATGDTSFDVLAGAALPDFAAATYHAVIYNLGIPGADAYDGAAATPNRKLIASTATATNIVLAGTPTRFPFESPGKRFHVVPNNSVIYSCSGSTLYRSTRAISATALASCPGAGGSAVALVTNVSCTDSRFTYTPAASQRNGLLTMTLVLTQSGESVNLFQEVHVSNVP